jgi:type I restriction enzyme S subunit
VDSGTKFGKIPEGWEVKKLGKVIDPQYGYTATAQDEPSFPKYLRGTDINKESFIQWSNVPNCSIDQKLYKKYKVQKYDVFIIRMADPGKIGICEREVDAVFASYLIRLEIKNDITPYYLFLTLTSEYFQGLITGSSSGTTRKSINAEYIKTINFILPPKELLTIFESKTQTFRENLTKLLEVNESLQEMRDLLIPQLATGKRELK